ncbi:nucleotidyl transferase AbiEii/AbiGii toxin family protein [uncultured Jatrophihabitans sp.]|uniref:nucleotidyl transferase AbiEii/AbiGii toxin family protein n=1 Tax=uncultured Jatrophihabitans sp. TaxID=1610747 RepID=UPI0035CABBA5
MSRPTRDSAAGRAYLDLQNRARAEKRGTQELLTLYAVERWLARLSASPYADQFILKGGMLLAAFGARRPTADADTLVRNLANDEVTVVASVIDIANQPMGHDDGIVFLVDTVRSRVIRDEELYSGVRVTMDCAVATAKIKLRLDINFGDPVTPAPGLVDIPALRDGDLAIRVLGYPIETVLAEKVATAIALGAANTRVRDFADVFTLTGLHSVTHAGARKALTATGAYRNVVLVPLSGAIGNLVELRARTYAAYRAGLGRDGTHLPSDFDVVVRAVASFADRLVEQADAPLRWNPRAREWEW